MRKNNFGIGLYSSTSPVINRSEQSFSLNQIFAEFNASDTDYSNLSSSDFFAGDIAENIQIEKALNLYKTLFKFFGVDLNKLQSDSLITGNKIDFSAAANQAENNINISQIVKDMYTNLEPTTKALNFNVFGTNIAVNSYNALVSAANLQLTLENTKTLNPNNTLLNSKIDEQLRENLADVNNLASYAALINQTNVDTFTKEFSDSNINQSVRSKIENSDLTNKPLFVSNSLQSDFGSSLNQSAPIVALTFFALVGLALLSSAGYVLVARRKTITFKNNKGLKITLSSMVVLGILLLVIIVPIAIIL